MNLKAIVSVCLAAAAMNAGAVMVVGDANTTTVITPSNTTITATQNATLTVTVPGEIEILLVGGGGGAGGDSASTTGYNSTENYRGGGGGGGGVVHKRNFQVTNGVYNITVGAGGALNLTGTAANLASATGGSTTGFGLAALGGGPGAPVTGKGGSIGGLGASGGGGASGSNGTISGGTALASDANGNLGHNGANASSDPYAGGGGGAGGAASSYTGGEGYPCDISGEMVYYGGGGHGGQKYKYATATDKGGGKSNYGGGGFGQLRYDAPQTGGPGIAIVRFTHSEDVARETSLNFHVSGYDRKGILDGGYRYLVITNDTTLHVAGSVSCDILLVGGGGGAGANADSGVTSCGGGGGGGGGVIHIRNFNLPAGDYPITVGAGGLVNTGDAETTVRGGDTAAFGLTAIGGGPGAKGSGYGPAIGNLGASGGGGATDGSSKVGSGLIYGGTAKTVDYCLGNDGADAPSYGSEYGEAAAYNSGGGGGAGGAADGVHGGNGYACDITGETVYYGGGGAGGQRDNSPAATPIAKAGLGGGKKSWGGGGSGGYRYTRNAEAGGHGIVIIRYRKREMGSVLSVR